MNIYIELIYLVFVLISAIIIHEYGHWFYLHRNNIKVGLPQFFVTKWNDFGFKYEFVQNLRNHQKQQLYLFGIVSGLIPIFSVMIFTPIKYSAFLIPIYVAGCHYDINQLIKIAKEEIENEDK